MNAPHAPALEYPFPTPPAPGTTLTVAPGVEWLRMPLPFALDHVNLWRLSTAHSRVLVDTGYGDAPTRALWDALLAGAPAPTGVICTHYHPDHAGNAAWLATRFGVPVRMTLGEWLTAQRFHAASVDGLAALFAAHGLAPAHVAALVERGNRYRSAVPEVPATFMRIIDGDDIEAAGTRWRVLVGHGHSPEHAALHAAESGLLIAGDMLLPRISTNVSISAAEPDGDPLARFLASLDALEALPAGTLVLPSHGLPFRGAALRVAALRAHHAARLAELADHVRAMHGPVAAADVLGVLFKRTLDLQQQYFAMGEAIAHLNYLWHRGALHRHVDAEGQIRFTSAA
ncbi:MAG: MBL fold metallo-hydrolase [Proteobacteria bacterium]|nr:MBL fold metallo-hydrolase [Pseudomonadota bacterium]